MIGPFETAADGQQPSPQELAREALVGWYRPRRRAYPWRAPARSGARFPDAYAVLVSECMLQQTQAPRVAPAFEAFLQRFPDVASLAAATRADVLRAWGRLGYPRRAVALHAAARQIVERCDGVVPRDPATLRALPGVGPYTAAAVASLAYGVPVAAVDTNVRRIWARVDHGAEPDEVPARDLAEAADRWLDRRRPAAWNQAVMDWVARSVAPRLGATTVRCDRGARSPPRAAPGARRPAARCGSRGRCVRCAVRSWRSSGSGRPAR